MKTTPLFAFHVEDENLFQALQEAYPTDAFADDIEGVKSVIGKGLFFINHGGHRYIMKFSRADAFKARWLLKEDHGRSLSISNITTRFLTVRDAAKFAGVSPRTLKGWYNQGLPYHKINGRCTRIDKEDIIGFIQKYRMVKAKTENVDNKVNDLVRKVING